MGGKLIQSHFGLPECRVSRADYFVILEEIKKTFKEFYPNCRIDAPKLLGSKSSAGDIDIVTDLQKTQVLKIIHHKYHPNPHYNGGVYSFPYIDPKVQIDVIMAGEKNYQTTLNFLSQGDASNILGRLANGQGLKFGHMGLNYTLYGSYFSGDPKDQNTWGDINLSIDTKEIMDFLDVSYADWERGFNTEEDVFDWVENSKYFNPRLFFIEELNHENRTRNRQRPFYMHFVNRITEKYHDQVFPRVCETYYFPRIIAHWPHILEEIEKYKEEYDKHYVISHKFNGKIVFELTGRARESLGEFMIAWKKQENWKGFVLAARKSEVEQKIVEFNLTLDKNKEKV